MILQLSQYQAAALRTEKSLPTQQERLEHALLGLITEVGEITTEVKRMEIYGKSLDDARRAHIAEEIGDVLWYLAIASDALGLNIFETHNANFEMPPASFKNCSFALAAVIGNLVDVAMRAERGEDDSAELQILLGTALTILDCASRMVGISLDTIAVSNIDKLRERFPDAYSNEAAEARADKGGLDARNS